jgi:NADH-quinone oxidoreductase subunit L
MTLPLAVLAVLSAVGGLIQVPLIHGGQRLDRFLEPVFADVGRVVGAAAHTGHAAGEAGLEIALMVISLVVALSGIYVAYRFYVVDPGAPKRVVGRVKGLYGLLFNKYWVDEIYDAKIVQPIVNGSVALWKRFDAAVIDGAVNGIAREIDRAAGLLRLAQTGYVQVYAMILTLGMVVVFGYLALR